MEKDEIGTRGGARQWVFEEGVRIGFVLLPSSAFFFPEVIESINQYNRSGLQRFDGFFRFITGF